MKKFIIIIVASLILMAAGTALGEPTLTEVLDNVYGSGNWTPHVGSDNIWYNPNGFAKAETKAKFASWSENFGYFNGIGPGGTFTSLFNYTGASGYLNGTPSATYTKGDTGMYFRFALNPNGTPSIWSSLASENSDGDHMYTFDIIGSSGGYDNSGSIGHHVIAWDDSGAGPDSDYQDLVIEVSGVSPIPAPGAFLLGSIGAGLVGWLRKNRTFS